MDVADDADGSLDPRIQIELENLNNATDDINKLETELDEAHTAFGQLLSESTRRFKEIVDKLGSSCIEKARCYYEALEVARQAQVQCQQQAQLFQRASEIHAAAKETVALAEARFMSHQHEWNFDQAWQDMLNHATLKVMDAENQKAECGREHHRRAMLFHDAEKKLLQLEEKHRRSIIKARPYFEVKAQCDQMLATQKERVECLQRAIKEAKKNYAASLRTLEEISNQIHQQRRDHDFVANGPREPGVGAELVSPDKNLNYESEFNQLNCNKTNSVTSGQFKIDSRSHDYDNICESKEDAEHLGKRSVDGSEATSPQWELELQVSVENLNNLSFENSIYDSDQENIRSSGLHLYEQKSAKPNNDGHSEQQESDYCLSQSNEFSADNLNQLQKLSKNFQILTKPLSSTSLMSHIQGLQTVKNVVADSLALNKSKLALKNYVSKSLNSSPINKNVSSSKSSKYLENLDCQDIKKYVPNETFKFGFHDQKSQSNNYINLSWNPDENAIDECQRSNNGSGTNDNLDNKTDAKTMSAQWRKETYKTEDTCQNDLNTIEEASSPQFNATGVVPPHLKKKEVSLTTKCRSNTSQIISHSAGSSPVKLKSSSNLPTETCLDKVTDDLGRYTALKILANKTASIKELPLLSIFEKSEKLAGSKDKSSSMINLDDKQSLMILLDNSHLENIQAISAERLANARDNLFQKVPR